MSNASRWWMVWMIGVALSLGACVQPAPPNTGATTAGNEGAAGASSADETAPDDVTSDNPDALRVGLVTSIGTVNDGTFNQYAHEGAVRAAAEFDLTYSFIETQSAADVAQNINTFVRDGFDVIVAVGIPITEATYNAARANPDITFIGVDQDASGERALPNLVGIQFREDQGGFLAGVLAGMVTQSNVLGFVGGMEVPSVKRFRNGFANGAQYVNPDVQVLGVFVPSFTDPAQGGSVATQFVGEGADVVFGAGGATSSGGIQAAASAGVYVIGVDQDEYATTFGNGAAPGADRILTSIIKRVDVGVYDQLKAIVAGTFTGNGNYVLDVTNDGLTYAPFHDAAAAVSPEMEQRLQAAQAGLADGSLSTGVDPVSGDVDAATVPAPEPFAR